METNDVDGGARNGVDGVVEEDLEGVDANISRNACIMTDGATYSGSVFRVWDKALEID